MNGFWRRADAPKRAISFLQLEQLEDRFTPAVTYHGGALIPHVAIEPVYLGAYWSTGRGAQQAADLNKFLSVLSGSAYMDILSEYNVGRGGLLDNGYVDTSVTGSKIDDSDIQRLLDQDIHRGSLAVANASRMYMVFPPPNVDVTQGNGDSQNNFLGYHEAFIGMDGRHIVYAVIPHPIGNNLIISHTEFQTLTDVVSHELTEGVTNPGGRGWFDSRSGEEIADLAQGRGDYGNFLGYAVQAIWSAKRNTRVLPAGTISAGQNLILSATPPSPSGFEHVADTFTHSTEYFTRLVQSDYQQLLGRSPGANELAYWVGLLRQGIDDDRIMVGFLASDEYFQRAGGTTTGWLNALYRDVLGRPADGGGLATWLNALATGTSRSQIALGFATSLEHESIVVTHDFQMYLGRTPADSEVATWVSAFTQHATNEQIVTGIVSSPEYIQRQGGIMTSWLASAYVSILGRAADQAGFGYWLGILQSG